MRIESCRLSLATVSAMSAVSGMAIGIVSCGEHPHAGQSRQLEPATAEVVAATGDQRAVFEQVVGTVRPKLQAAVTPKVAGRIANFAAVPGARVEAGQVIAELAAGELTASVERAEATLEQARRERNRYERLLRQNAVTQAEFDAIDSQYQIAGATVDETRAMADYTTVTAPFAGVITRKFQEQGDMASPNQPMFELEDSSRLQLVIDVPESLAGSLELGETLSAAIDGAGAELQGTIAELSPAADAMSRTFRVKLDIPSDPLLRSGQFGRAALPRGRRDAILVPQSAVIQRGQMDYVFVADDGAASLRIVRAGATANAQTEILSGLDAGERVVADPPSTLQDGQPLEN